MIRAITYKNGTQMNLLVPFHSLSGSAHLLRGLKVQNAPAVFIPVNRG
ncbi:MAG: hypothetical protein HY553_10370 [Elusimicrobia bacterium]|nr:hypothetical protein [Elusimicrobiota bacterium]